jgi:putative transcriptional regulator
VIRRRINDLLNGRSRYWLAQESGVSQGNLKRLARQETTGIDFDTLEKICRALGCKIGDLLVIVDDEETGKLVAEKQMARKAAGKKKRR